MSRRRVIIVGAGPAGLAVGMLLKARGWDVSVVEKRRDPIAFPYSDSRSVNFTLSPRGIFVLKSLGAWPRIEPCCVGITGRSVHIKKSEQVQHYESGAKDPTLYSVTRATLIQHMTLFARTEYQLDIRFDCEYEDFDVGRSKVRLTHRSETFELDADLVIGADGARSRVAETIRRHSGVGRDLWCFDWTYRRFEITAEEGAQLGLRKRSVHFFPFEDLLVLALPNRDSTFSCNLFLKPFEGSPENEWRRSQRAFSRCSSKHALLAEIVDRDFARYPDSLLESHLEPTWHVADKVALVGDSARSVFHFYAQGLNASLEDAHLFVRSVDLEPDLEAALVRYQRTRMPDAIALRVLSREHFFFLKDKAGSVAHRLLFRCRKLFAACIGRPFRNTYLMVVSPEFSYHEAYLEIRRQSSAANVLREPINADNDRPRVPATPEAVLAPAPLESLRADGR